MENTIQIRKGEALMALFGNHYGNTPEETRKSLFKDIDQAIDDILNYTKENCQLDVWDTLKNLQAIKMMVGDEETRV